MAMKCVFTYGDLLEAKADLCMARLDLLTVDEEMFGLPGYEAEKVQRTIRQSKAMRHLVTVKSQRRRYERMERKMKKKVKEGVKSRANFFALQQAAAIQKARGEDKKPWMDDVATFNKIAPEWQKIQQERTATPAGGTAKAVPGFSDSGDDTADTEPYESEAFKKLPKGLQKMVRESKPEWVKK